MSTSRHPTPPHTAAIPGTTGLHPPLLLLTTLAALLAPPHPATAQAPPATPPPLDLATLFDFGHLLLDENGDSVPDRLGATLVLAPEPTTAERVAAAEIAARLGFETMALDLPLRRGFRPGQVGILIGHRALQPLGAFARGLRHPHSGLRHAPHRRHP